MANTLPTFNVFSVDKFFPTLKPRLQKLSRVTNDFSTEISKPGQSLTLNYQSAISASRYGGSYTTPTDETVGSVTLTIQKPLFKEFYLDPEELGSFTPEYLSSRMAGAVQPVFNEVEKLVLAVAVQSPNPLASVSASAAGAFAAIQSGSNFIRISGSIAGPVTYVVPQAVYTAMESDAKASGYTAWNTIASGVEEFQYGRALVSLSSNIATTTAVFLNADSVAVGLRLPPLIEGTKARYIVTDEQTGASLAVDLIPDPIVVGGLRGRAHVLPAIARGRQGATATYTIA